MKKALIWIVSIIGIPALLLTLVAILLYMPPVQQWLVQQTTRYASKKLGLEVLIDKVRLAFPLDLSMENVLIIRPKDEGHDWVCATNGCRRTVVAFVQKEGGD